MRLACIFNTTRPDTTGIYFERACRTMGVVYEHWELGQAAQIPPVYDGYVRFDHGDDYEVRLPSCLRPVVFYAIDTHLPKSWHKIRRAAPWYDLVCCAQRDAANRLPGAEWLPLVCDEACHGAREVSRRWDVACVGHDGGVPRKFYLQALRERYPNSCIGQADYTQLGLIYSQARIGFNYSIADDVNMRIFEVLAAKTLLLTNALTHDALARLGLRDRHELVLYRTPQELFQLMDYYLAHAEERDSIAAAGAAVVRERHTYAHRVQRLMEWLQQRFSSTATHQAPLEQKVPCASS